jgi:hypothetical protein
MVKPNINLTGSESTLVFLMYFLLFSESTLVLRIVNLQDEFVFRPKNDLVRVCDPSKHTLGTPLSVTLVEVVGVTLGSPSLRKYVIDMYIST